MNNNDLNYGRTKCRFLIFTSILAAWIALFKFYQTLHCVSK